MVKLENYSGLTSSHEDLLEKNYCLKYPLVLKLKPKTINDFFLGAKTAMKSGQFPVISTNIKYTGLKDLKLSTKIDSDGKLKIKAETTAEQLKNSKITSELGLFKHEVSSASIALDYQIVNKLKTKIKISDGPLLDVQTNFALLDVSGIAFSSTLDLSSAVIDSINVALWYKKDKTNLVIKHESDSLQLQNLSFALFHQIKKLKLGGQLLINLQENKNNLECELGMQYKLEKNLKARAKVDQDGVVSAGIDSKLGENCKFTLATQHSLLKYKFLGPWEWGIVVEMAA